MALNVINKRFIPVILLSSVTLSACSSSVNRDPVTLERPSGLAKDTVVKTVTPRERRMDHDNDGQLSVAEIKELLNGSYTLSGAPSS